MSHHFIQFEEIHYGYSPDSEVLRGIDLRLEHGEKVALVGANGAGKSTLLLHSIGLLTPSRGRVVVGGITLSQRTVAQIRQTIGFVFQNADDQLFMPTVEEDIAFGPANMQLSREEIEERVVSALAAVGALSLRKRSPQQLSGGEKRRVAIATVLAMEPSILVMDEPSAALDPRARRDLIALLKEFRHTALIATHDLAMARELCPRTVVMHAGQIAADGPTTAILNDQELMDHCGL